jgi:hypothetical protein
MAIAATEIAQVLCTVPLGGGASPAIALGLTGVADVLFAIPRGNDQAVTLDWTYTVAEVAGDAVVTVVGVLVAPVEFDVVGIYFAGIADDAQQVLNSAAITALDLLNAKGAADVSAVITDQTTASQRISLVGSGVTPLVPAGADVPASGTLAMDIVTSFSHLTKGNQTLWFTDNPLVTIAVNTLAAANEILLTNRDTVNGQRCTITAIEMHSIIR